MSKMSMYKFIVENGFQKQCGIAIFEIQLSLSKASIDCNQELGTFDLEKQEVDAIRDLVSSLEPVKFGAEKLADRTSTLLSAAECIFSYILNELE